jgi:nucleoid-associated protein YgaU
VPSTRKVSWKRLVDLAVIATGVQAALRIFSKSETSDINWRAIFRVALIVIFFLIPKWIKRHPDKEKIVTIVRAAALTLILLSFMLTSPTCSPGVICTAIANSESPENGLTSTPYSSPSQQPTVSTLGQTTQSPLATETELPAATATLSPVIPSGDSSGNKNETPLAETQQAKATCKPLETLKIEGLTDWPYTVKTGDTLFGIAQFFLGDASRWPELFMKNPESFGDLPSDGTPPKIYPGQQIIIPNVMAPLYLTVMPGDTLTNMGGKAYGNDYSSGRFWCTIYWQNSDRIGIDPSLIQVGQVFVIYPLVLPSEDEIVVPPDSTFASLLAAYYVFPVDGQAICILQGEKFGDLCEDVLPFDLLYFPHLPPLKNFRVEPGETLEVIVFRCYGEVTQQLMMIARTVNRKIIGDDPTFIHVGQTMTLYGCKVSI